MNPIKSMHSMSTAPRDGTTITGVYEDNSEYPIFWSERPLGCSISGWATAPESETCKNLSVTTPEHWEPYNQKKGNEVNKTQKEQIARQIQEDVIRLFPSLREDVEECTYLVKSSVKIVGGCAEIKTTINYDIRYMKQGEMNAIVLETANLPEGMVPAVKPEPGYVPKRGEIA